METILKAISFAGQKHDGQFRKDNKTPYICHPMRVALILSNTFGVEDKEALVAAILHDTLEDTQTDYDELLKQFKSKRIADWVAFLTKDRRLPERERERNYLSNLEKAPDSVKLIKLADIYDNLMDAIGSFSKSEIQKRLRKAKKIIALFKRTESKDVNNAVQFVEVYISSLLQRSYV